MEAVRHALRPSVSVVPGHGLGTMDPASETDHSGEKRLCTLWPFQGRQVECEVQATVAGTLTPTTT